MCLLWIDLMEFPKLQAQNWVRTLLEGSSTYLIQHTKVIRKVRKRRHRNPPFGHIGDEISKKQVEKNVHLGFNGVWNEPQFSPKFGAKLSSSCTFFPPERLQSITDAAMCTTVAINDFEPRAFNPESQNFIPLFNKISLLCGYRPGEDETSNDEGGTQGMTLHITRVCTGNLTALGRCSNCGRLHHLTRAALFQSMLDGREISPPSRWFGRLLSVCFQSFFHHVNCVSFNLVRPLW
jgi:hypothetical protein